MHTISNNCQIRIITSTGGSGGGGGSSKKATTCVHDVCVHGSERVHTSPGAMALFTNEARANPLVDSLCEASYEEGNKIVELSTHAELPARASTTTTTSTNSNKNTIGINTTTTTTTTTTLLLLSHAHYACARERAPFQAVAKGRPMQILFVDLSNTCRSPAAEATMRRMIQQAALASDITVRSCRLPLVLLLLLMIMIITITIIIMIMIIMIIILTLILLTKVKLIILQKHYSNYY